MFNLSDVYGPLYGGDTSARTVPDPGEQQSVNYTAGVAVPQGYTKQASIITGLVALLVLAWVFSII